MNQEVSSLKMTNISKHFQGQPALVDVDFEMNAGEIHALLGQNGSGKSTLIKILAGFHRPDDGAQTWIDGKELAHGSVTEAHRRGVRVLHQDLALIDELSVIDNLALGHTYFSRRWVSERTEGRAAKQLLSDFDVDVDPNELVGSLRPAEKTMVAIVRAMRDGAATSGVLVLDEPTATLPDRETDQLFELVRGVAARGGSVLYVTHRLQEVFRLAHRVTVLRDGRNVATRQVAELDHDALIELIVGRRVDTLYPGPPTHQRQDVALEVTSVAGAAVKESSFTVHAGEIVGIAGLAGSGLEDLLPLVFGAIERRRGAVSVSGVPLLTGSPRTSIAAGLAYAPSDRKHESAITEWTLAENLTLPSISTGRLGWISPRRERREAMTWLKALDVVPADPAALFSSLSGGNQQKTVISRWLRCKPKALMMQEPTAGVDVGARALVYDALRDMADSGVGVLISSTDVEELCGLCSRVLIMNRGRLTAELTASNMTEDQIMAEILRDGSTAHAQAGL